MTGQIGRQLLDAVVAGQIHSADEWMIDQLAELDRLIPDYVLLLTRVAIADLTVRLRRAELGQPHRPPGRPRQSAAQPR